MANILTLYFDDSGPRLPDQKPSISSAAPDYFALGGVLIEASDVRRVWEQHRLFCGSWSITYPLHSHKIRNRRGQFGWLRAATPARRRSFFEGLTRLVCDSPICVIACVIDRPGYNSRYKPLYGENRWSLCKTAFAVLAERAAKFADRWNFRLTVHYEGSGEREDRAIEGYLKELKSVGMPFASGTSGKYSPLSASDFKRIILGDAQRVTKLVPICQIADLVLHPVAMAGYSADHRVYRLLKEKGTLIDCAIHPEDAAALGIKYSCFQKNERPGQ